MDVVVCDDDPRVRQMVSDVAERLGYRVLAETDRPWEAAELVDRFGAGLLVLDLSLPYGNGLDALDGLRDKGSPCRIVVFSAYSSDHDDLLRRGAAAVVDKVRFDDLEDVLRSLGQTDRRRTLGGRLLPSRPPTTPRGLESPAAFRRGLDQLRAGDIAMVFELDRQMALIEEWGPLGAADLVLQLAGIIRAQVRIQDRLFSMEGRRLELLLLGASGGGADAVFCRLVKARDAVAAHEFSAGWAIVSDDDEDRDALLRAHRALEDGLLVKTGGLWADEGD